MKRMYGDFEMSPGHRTRTRRKKRESSSKQDLPDGGPNLRKKEDDFELEIEADGDSFFGSDNKKRDPRQSFGKNRNNDSGRYIFFFFFLNFIKNKRKKKFCLKLRSSLNFFQYFQS